MFLSVCVMSEKLYWIANYIVMSEKLFWIAKCVVILNRALVFKSYVEGELLTYIVDWKMQAWFSL